MNEDSVKVTRVIVTTLVRRGSGTVDDPHRRVTQFWSEDGALLIEDDRFAPAHCNAAGHRVMPGCYRCRNCGVTLDEMVRKWKP